MRAKTRILLVARALTFSRWLFIAATLSTTFAALGLLVRRVPTVQKLPLWFWAFRDKPTSAVVFVFLALSLLPIILYTKRKASRFRGLLADVAPLIVFGLLLQFGLAASEMRGIQGIRDRFLRSGHVQFAHIAVFEPDLVDVLRNYDVFTTKPNMIFARSKPPGAVIVYILNERASKLLPQSIAEYAPEPDISPSLLRSANMAVILFPLLSLLVLFPLAALSRALLPPPFARWPPLLYLLCPPVELIPLHLDQAIYPLFHITLVLTLFLAARELVAKRAALLVAAAGGLVWLSLFISFSLLPAVLMAVVFGALELLAVAKTNARARIHQIARGIGIAAVVFLVLSLVAYALIRYNPITRFEHAISHHQHFKTWEPSVSTVSSSIELDVLEYIYILGLPVMAAFAWSLGGVLKRVRTRETSSFDRFAVVTAFFLVLLPITSMTQGEVARLWLFFVPNIVLVATAGLCVLFPPRLRFGALTTVAVLELVWTIALKANSDFF